MAESGPKNIPPHIFLAAGIIIGCITLYLLKSGLYGLEFIDIAERKVVICIFAVIFDFYTSGYDTVLPEGVGLLLATEWWVIFILYYSVSFRSPGIAFKKMLIYHSVLVLMGLVLFSRYITDPPSVFWFVLIKGVIFSLAVHIFALPVLIPVRLFLRKDGENIPDINSDKNFGLLKEKGYIVTCPFCGTRYLSIPYICYKCGSEIRIGQCRE